MIKDIDLTIKPDGSFEVAFTQPENPMLNQVIESLIVAYTAYLMTTKYFGKLVTKETREALTKELTDFCEREITI